ncbi:MAG: hypothetical protein ACTSYQ_02085 [Candidatus Odinarchaeia archaeon]
MGENELVKELCETLVQLSDKLLVKFNSLIAELNKKFDKLFNFFTTYNNIFSRIQIEKEDFITKFSINPSNSEFLKSVDKVIYGFKSDFSNLNDLKQEVNNKFGEFNKSFTESINSVKRNVELISREYQSSIKELKKQIKDQDVKINNLESNLEKLTSKYDVLMTDFNKLKEAYTRLNNQYQKIERVNNENKLKLKNLSDAKLALEREKDQYQKILNKIVELYRNLMVKTSELKREEIKLPSKIILSGLSGEFKLTEINKFFNNISQLLVSDLNLLAKFKNSKAFKSTLENSSYIQVLEHLFKNIKDAEEKEFNKVKNIISDVELLINDPKRQRYLHLELFAPYLRSSRVLLSTFHEKLTKAAEKLASLVKEKIDDPEIKRLLVRRTGIRNLKLDNCQLSSYEIPLDLNKIDDAVNNLLNEINSSFKEKQNDIQLRFFEIWRGIAKELKNKTIVDKVVSYTILTVTKNILDKTKIKNSDIKKLFSKSIVLI